MSPHVRRCRRMHTSTGFPSLSYGPARLREGHMRYLQLACIIFFASAIGCNATEGRGNNGHGGGGGDDAGVGGGGGDDGGGGGLDDGGVWTNPDGPTVVMDPVTCDEAAANKSYIGCDYWPTVVANAVWSIFDFA